MYYRSSLILTKRLSRSVNAFRPLILNTRHYSVGGVVPAAVEDVATPRTDISLATSPYYNQGTVLCHQARDAYGLAGFQPAGVETLDVQKQRALKQLRAKQTPLDKYVFLAQLRNSNTRLFYKVVGDHLEEIAPIIYTPTVGQACQEYSNIYPFLAPPGAADGLYLTINDLPHIRSIIQNYRKNSPEAPVISVVTDGSRILGLGDLGMGGLGISIGKLQLYVAGAGIDPRKTLPIVLDFGTDNEKYLNDPFYLGLKQKRPSDKEFYAAMDQVMEALYDVYPEMLVQFEDFSSAHAFGLLEKYQNQRLCFNDDIQGTGAVILAGFINAIRIAQEKANVDPHDHRIVFFGAGSSAIGVGKLILGHFMRQYGLSQDEAKKMFYFVDSKGLITSDRGDKLAQHKVFFARSDNNQAQFKSLGQVIDHVRPTALIGLSAQSQAFTPEVLDKMAKQNKLPIVFPLSNPMTNAECTFEQAMQFTDHRVLFASGTAFPPYQMPSGEIVKAGQGNNMYVFPGLGLGSILAKTAIVSDDMIYEAAKSLAQSLKPQEIQQGHLYPDLDRIREVSAKVAAAVCRQAIAENVARDPRLIALAKTSTNNQELEQNLLTFVRSNMWDPNHSELFDAPVDTV
ncbi:malic enzyme [Radiomyces spectabilis]|uniref:malic enzyme n=1 Tax=Radiomyces spectabilis TaxID=64574 RepID=UPI00221EDA06|nr:malic enzyme [Radiomyces spectabilis]KAI8372882.1 malic enzyme [Radiomyces spectabilis]